LTRFERGAAHVLRASKIRGAQLAIVVDNKDGPDNPGYRVKVKLPWLSEQESTFWARIAVPMGGPGRGTYVLPEIDDQVLVVFEHGDVHRPIIIGGLWSKQQEPVENNQSGKNNTKLIKSRSGHRIIFDDKQGAENITIVDSTRRNKIVLDSIHEVVKIESDGEIEVKAKTNVILHANVLRVGSSDGVTGKGASLFAHAAKMFSLKASRGITIGGGNTQINISNSAACSVSGSGAGEIGGAAEEVPHDPREAQDPIGTGGRTAGSERARALGGAPVNAGPGSRAPLAVEPDAWIGLELVDERGDAVAGAAYKVVSGNGDVRVGAIGADGKARVTGVDPGRCKISFLEYDPTEWKPAAHPELAGQLHRVESGEHLAEIAHHHGFRSLATLWDHPNNADLKRRRKNPLVLQPGDELFVPSRSDDTASADSGASHRFVLKGEILRLRLKLLSLTGKPLGDAICTLTVDGAEKSVRTDASGLLETVVPRETRRAILVAGGQRYDLLVGGLDPIDCPVGLHARLRNLGYPLDADDAEGKVDAEQLRFALELFQLDQRLPITGTADAGTLQRIEQLAGC
jgi:phage baseplate assembly protein gpV